MGTADAAFSKSSAQSPPGSLSSRQTRSSGFLRMTAVLISLKQFGEAIECADWKNTDAAQSRMCCAMFCGQSLPAGMPSSYQRRTQRSRSRRIVSNTASESLWE